MKRKKSSRQISDSDYPRNKKTAPQSAPDNAAFPRINKPNNDSSANHLLGFSDDTFLNVNKELLSAILEQLPAAVGLIDKEGRFLLANSLMQKLLPPKIPSRDTAEMLRWQSVDADGKPVPPDQWPGARALRGENVSPGMEFIHFDEYGQETWRLVSAVPFRSPYDTFVGAIVTVHDITERKKAESQRAAALEALRQSEEKFRTTFESAVIGIALVDLNGRIMSSNPAFQKMIGYGENELKGLHFRDITHPDDAKKDIEYAEEVFTGKRDFYKIEKRYISKQGQTIITELTSSVVRDSKGKPLFGVGMVEDRTKQKESEQALKESEKLYRTLADNLPGGAAFILDKDLKFIMAGGQGLETSGFAPASFEGKTVEEVLGRSVFDEYAPFFRQALVGKSFRHEHTSHGRHYISEGVPIRNDSGRVSNILVMFYDITERKRWESQREATFEALRRSEEQFRKALEEAPIPVIMHAEDGEVLQISRAWTELTGYKVEDIRRFDQWITNVVYGEGANEVRDYMKELFNSSSNRSVKEFDIRTKNGDIRRWNFRASVPGKLTDGRYFIVGMALDITERKKYEDVLKRDKETFEKLIDKRTKELLEAHLELEKTKRLSDIGTLAATVAHELRNPLAAINVASENIKRKVNDERVDKSLLNINRKVKESERIIENLLFYSRVRPPNFQTVRPYDIINESIGESSFKEMSGTRLVDKGLKGIKDVLIQSDGHQLKEVFLNLLNNAYDAVDKEHGRVELNARIDDGIFEFTVKDNGSGIKKDDLNKVTDPFFTTKSKGTGLGLSVTKQIIEFHNGSLNIESEEGRGTVVTVRIPVWSQIKIFQ
jgi:PAS domain S-box-containing protein